MRLTRRHLIALAAASAGAPLLAGCDGDKPGVIPDTRFPIGPFGADSTAEEVTAGLDLRLNEKGYILPGLGDAGDRLYGTV